MSSRVDDSFVQSKVQRMNSFSVDTIPLRHISTIKDSNLSEHKSTKDTKDRIEDDFVCGRVA